MSPCQLLKLCGVKLNLHCDWKLAERKKGAMLLLKGLSWREDTTKYVILLGSMCCEFSTYLPSKIIHRTTKLIYCVTLHFRLCQSVVYSHIWSRKFLFSESHIVYKLTLPHLWFRVSSIAVLVDAKQVYLQCLFSKHFTKFKFGIYLHYGASLKHTFVTHIFLRALTWLYIDWYSVLDVFWSVSCKMQSNTWAMHEGSIKAGNFVTDCETYLLMKDCSLNFLFIAFNASSNWNLTIKLIIK